jgi:hypothetical protein
VPTGGRKSRPPPPSPGCNFFVGYTQFTNVTAGRMKQTPGATCGFQRPGVGDTCFAANEIRIGISFQTFAGLCIMYVCMHGVCVCVLCAHAHVYTKHPLPHHSPLPSNYKFSELPMREPNTAFSTSRFMTANHPRSCVYRLLSYFEN